MEKSYTPFEDDENFYRIKDTLVNQILHDFNSNLISPDERNQAMVDLIIQKFREQEIPISDDKRDPLFRQVINEVLGFGILQPFLDDPDVTEILVNGKDSIFVTRNNELILLPNHFRSNEDLIQLIFRNIKRLNLQLDPDNPTLDTRLPDGSQLSIILPPLSVDRPIISIHKSSICKLSIYDLVDQGTLSISISDFLQACVVARLNILVIGLGITGKTTLLNSLSNFIPQGERIISIEEKPQLTLDQDQFLRLSPHSAHFEGKPFTTPSDLVHLAMNMNPDRLIIDELRGSEGLAFLQALNTGSSGSMASLRANSPMDAISHLETMCLMSGVSFPTRVLNQQVASALDLIIHISRYKDGSRRITTITEISGMESDNVILTDIFRFEQSGLDTNGKLLGSLKPTGIRPLFASRLETNGYKLNPETFGTNLIDFLRNE